MVHGGWDLDALGKAPVVVAFAIGPSNSSNKYLFLEMCALALLIKNTVLGALNFMKLDCNNQIVTECCSLVASLLGLRTTSNLVMSFQTCYIGSSIFEKVIFQTRVVVNGCSLVV